MLARLARYPPLPTGSRVAVVGGFVRDAMLGIEPRELDLVIEDDAAAYARRFPGGVTVYEDFGTATVCGPDWRVDVAMARRERYPAAGALPVVEPATIEEDLERRDFAANAIAITLDGDVLAVEHALAEPDPVAVLARIADKLPIEVDRSEQEHGAIGVGRGERERRAQDGAVDLDRKLGGDPREHGDGVGLCEREAQLCSQA